MIQCGVQRVTAPDPGEVAAERTLVPRCIVDVGVRRLHRLDAREVVDAPASADVARQHLVRGAANLIAAVCRNRLRAPWIEDLVLIEQVRPYASVVAAAHVVAVLAPDALTGLRKPVVEER